MSSATPELNAFSGYVLDVVGGEIEDIFKLNTKEFNQKAMLSTPNNPDGLADRFAPSDEDLGIQ